MLNSGRSRIKADMGFECCEVNQITMQRKGRHLIAYFLIRIRSRSPDGRPDLLQSLADLHGKTRNVLVDTFRRLLFHHFSIFFSISQSLPPPDGKESNRKVVSFATNMALLRRLKNIINMPSIINMEIPGTHAETFR